MPTPKQTFLNAQQRLLDRHGVAARARFVDVPAVAGHAQVLSCGAGPEVVALDGLELRRCRCGCCRCPCSAGC